ncbi:hypothetical protein BU24DRAFT_167832 [Aaosphaeria arxii CBS 175.79]|uniref:Uncharacterized protein n=1 Tax=Aaosphaeria arxii CBS 175.79 TaxID=1450172 RepID=A0A6A5XZD1_9PLEO|nr:uncharacterized protein BU24DRAFT_167832 [Aaosphaeria arxii CBS 175.79]KAF2018263.1 hypothetical protein BU24DRAFT_167832 [Aaosphaeria arxii CBS 175.79]
MGYERILSFTLVPTILLLVLSFVSTILTTTYWIFGDWVLPRYFLEGKDVPGKPELNESLIEYVTPATDATVATAAIGIFAGVVCVLGYTKLRKGNMDLELNKPRRRFWVAFVQFWAGGVAVSALATIIVHYTTKGDDQFGCTSYKDATGGKVYECTREMGACNVLPEWRNQATEKSDIKTWAIPVTCQMITATKWMQLIIMLDAIVIIAMFSVQARLRSKSRYGRLAGKESIGMDPR